MELLEEKVMLSADMAALFGHGSAPAGAQAYSITAAPESTLVTEDGETIFFDPIVELDTNNDIAAAPGDGTYWNDIEDVNLENTFLLNSNPDANHTIYLDFNGHETSGTAWNTFSGLDTIVSPAYDFDGDPTAFSEDELLEIQKIWARVAEDFAPFNVNVTTVQPLDIEDLKFVSVDGITPDERWGVRVVIGDDAMGTGAGGIAYLNSFNSPLDLPVFSFNGQFEGGSNVAAMTVSHEVGHALGLRHDGDSTREYYSGHGNGQTSWGPIMGAPFSSNVTQWSNGEYTDASNKEDDLAIITTDNGFGYLPDDYGDDFGSSTTLVARGATDAVTTYGIIGTNTDVDVFSFYAGEGEISFDFDVPELGPGEPGASNLDILVALYDGSQNLIQLFNEPATLNTELKYDLVGSGLYYLEVVGVGFGQPNSPDDPFGYTAYGSLGNYRITGSVQPFTDSFVDIVDSTASEFEDFIAFNVLLDNPSQEDIILTLTTDDGTAVAGKDYVATTMNVRIPAGSTQSETPFIVPLINDLVSEPTENFTVRITNVVQGEVAFTDDIGVGTILDNDDPLALYLSIDRDWVGEEEGPRAAKATVERNGDLSAPLTVQIENSDESELYVPKFITFAVGQDTTEFFIETVNDGALDGHQLDVSLKATAPNFLSFGDTVDVRNDDTTGYRTLGGHLFEPITPFNNYKVIKDIIVDPGRGLDIQGSLNFSTELNFAPGVGMYIHGYVVADADGKSPILFEDESERDYDAPAWAGIHYSAEGQQKTLFENVIIKDAITGLTVFAADEPLLRVANSSIHSNEENGVEVTARNGDDVDEDEVQILDSKIYDNGEHGVLVSSFNTEFAMSRSAPLIEGNEIYGHVDGAGVYLLANTSLAEINPEKAESIVAPRIFSNKIHDNMYGIKGVSTRIDNDQNFTVVAPIAHNNLISHNSNHAIDLNVFTQFGLLNADIINNTIVENGGAGLHHSNMTDESFSVRNNIFAHNLGGGIFATGPFTPLIESVMRNLMWENGGQDWVNYPAEFGSKTSYNVNRTPSDPEKNISGDPNFSVDGQFRISPDSIAVNAGTRFEDDPLFGGYEGVEAPRLDFFGNPRDFLRDIGYHEIAGQAFPYYEDFEDRAAQFFIPQNPSQWTISQRQNGTFYYEANTLGNSGLGVSLFSFDRLGPDFDVSVKMSAISGPNRWNDGFIIFDYKNENDFKYAGMFVGQNQWVVGHYQGNWGERFIDIDWDATNRKINRDQEYHVHLRIEGNRIQLAVDGELIATRIVDAQDPLNDGQFGLGNHNGLTHFDDFRTGFNVLHGRTFTPIAEEFGFNLLNEPVIPTYFEPSNPNAWTAIDLFGDATIESNTLQAQGSQKLATIIAHQEGTISSNYRVESVINTSAVNGHWSDGFIIFDYKNQNDFKYAGMFTGQNQWVIGHFQGNFGNRLAQVDWDNQGREIDNGKKYEVAVEISANKVKLIVDDELVTQATFNNVSLLNKGSFGLASYNARTRFHSFHAMEIAPPTAAPAADNVFAAGDLFYFDDEEEEVTIAAGSNKVID